jgi:hypothetical protein
MLVHVFGMCSYHDDSQIPADPEESPSVNEASSSSILGRLDSGTGAGDDTACAVIPWYPPGTEPPPEDLAPAAFQNGAADGYNAAGQAPPGGYIDDAAMGNVLAQLPPSLQALDIHTLRMLVQDPALVQSIIRADGSVDEINLAAFKRSVGAEPMYGIGHFGPEGAHYDNGGQRRSRWGGDAPPSDPYHAPDPYARPAPASYEFDYDYDPYGPPRGAAPVYADRPPPALHDRWNAEYIDPLGPGPGPGLGGRPQDLPPVGGRSVQNQRRFPTTKAATPCRFFNTAKGCQFGDKCSFGHFLGVSNLNDLQQVDSFAAPALVPDRGAQQWGPPGPGPLPGPGHAPAGPGRNSRFGGPGRSGPGSGIGMHGLGGPGSGHLPPTFVPPPMAVPGTMPAPADFAVHEPVEEQEVKRKRRFH